MFVELQHVHDAFHMFVLLSNLLLYLKLNHYFNNKGNKQHETLPTITKDINWMAITSPDLPHPYFLFSPLVAPGNTRVSLPLQLMKATVLAESYYISFIFIVIYGLQ